MPCRPCQAKEILNQDAFDRVSLGEKMRKKVEKAVSKGKMTEDDAQAILEPLMAADRDYLFLVDQALVIAQGRYDRALAEN